VRPLKKQYGSLNENHGQKNFITGYGPQACVIILHVDKLAEKVHRKKMMIWQKCSPSCYRKV